MSNKIIDRYNRQKGKSTSHLVASDDPVDNYINAHQKANEMFRQQQEQKRINKHIQEQTEKEIKKAIEQTFKDLSK